MGKEGHRNVRWSHLTGGQEAPADLQTTTRNGQYHSHHAGMASSNQDGQTSTVWYSELVGRVEYGTVENSMAGPQMVKHGVST